MRICDAKFGMLFRLRRQGLPLRAASRYAAGTCRISTGGAGRFNRKPAACSIALCGQNRWATPPTKPLKLSPMPSAKLGGARSIVAVPMLKDDELVGAIVIYRQEVRPFTDKQIELVQEFRHPGRHRHREYPPAQRAARIAAAADRHRRRAQGHQPLDLRSANGAADAGRIGGAALRRRQWRQSRARRMACFIAPRLTGSRLNSSRCVRNVPVEPERGYDDRTCSARRQSRSHSRCAR